MTVISPITIAGLETYSNFQALLDEYGEECAIEGMPPPSAKLPIYRLLEATGVFHIFAAIEGDNLIGFISLVVAPLPHYDGASTAISESFFVAKNRRSTGAGLKLLAAVEDLTDALGAAGPLVSAPFKGTLAEILPRLGYVEVGRTFFKKARS